MLETLQASAFAKAIAQSQVITAGLSAVHALGFAMVTSSALVAGLRILGGLFGDRPAIEILRPASRVLFAGLVINILTGALLFSPRAASAAANPFFRSKMILLACAIAVQVVVMRGVMLRSRSGDGSAPSLAAGATGLLLWLGVAVAACAFVLIE
jgi:hypothetical protein